MHDDVADDSDTTLDRRALIKKIGVAGAVAWTAPVVMDSVLSPAAAQSSPGGPGGPTFPLVIFTGSFNGITGTGTGSGYFVHPGGTNLIGWTVTGTNVDGVDVPGPYGTTPFDATGATQVVELGGTYSGGGNTPGGITRSLSLDAGTYVFEFDWINRSATNTGTASASGTGVTESGSWPTLAPSTLSPVQTFTQAFTVASTTTVTLAITTNTVVNDGPMISFFSLTQTA